MLGISAAKPSEFAIPEDAVFERADVLPHDAAVKPTNSDAIHLEGRSDLGQVVEYLHVDEAAGTFTHELRQDIEPVLKNVHDMVMEGGRNAGKNKAGDFYLAARVPPVVIHAWLNERGLHMSDFKGKVIDEFLNDTENKPFRVWQGRV